MFFRVVPPLVAIALAASAGSAPAGEPGQLLPGTSFELPSGLQVTIHEDHSSPQIAVYVAYDVGSKDEQPGRTGFAQLFEHLMSKGSKHGPDGEFDRLLERRENYENAPYGLAELRRQQTMWPKGHGNCNLTIGTMEDLSAASLADVEALYRANYAPNQATLVIAGDVDPAAARALVERYFGWMPRRAAAPHVTLESPVTPLEGELRLALEDDVQLPKVIDALRDELLGVGIRPAVELDPDGVQTRRWAD